MDQSLGRGRRGRKKKEEEEEEGEEEDDEEEEEEEEERNLLASNHIRVFSVKLTIKLVHSSFHSIHSIDPLILVSPA